MAKTVEDELQELRKEVEKLSRIQAMKDKSLLQQQRTIAEQGRKISMLSAQIQSLSTSLSRLR